MIYFIVNIILFLLCGVIIDFPTALVFLFAVFIGSFIIWFFNLKERYEAVEIFQIVFCAGFIYILACFMYMTSHDFTYLIAFDIGHFFLPRIENFLSNSDSFSQILDRVWNGFMFFDRNIPGYDTYQLFWGYYGKCIQANLYITLQLATLLLAGFISVILYRIFVVVGFERRKCQKYTLIISVFSILFVYSTVFLRDIHITLAYLCCIYLVLKPFDGKNMLLLILLVVVCFTLRRENGVFALIFIPTFILSNFSHSRNKAAVFLLSVVAIIGLLFVFLRFGKNFEEISSFNDDYYNAEDISKGGGVIARLQLLPIIGQFLSIFYNALMPIPCWGKMSVAGFGGERPECYNIMNYTFVFSSIINWFAVTMMMVFLFVKRIRITIWKQISLNYKLLIGVGFVFLLLQSHVVSQRRLMVFYCLFYVLAFLVYTIIPIKKRRDIVSVSFVLYVFVNLVIGLLTLI